MWEQNCVWLIYYFNFERNYDVLKSKNPCIFLNKNINFSKNEKESKMENPAQNFRETNIVLQHIQEWQIKSIKLWWVRARERQKRAFFVPFILSEENFFNIFILSQCIVYWIQFQNIRTFTYQKTLLHTLFCLFLKLSKAFSVSLNQLFYLSSANENLKICMPILSVLLNE